VALLAAMAVTGCTATVDGDPAAGPTGSQLPPRPSEVKVEDLDPCALLTADQLDQLDVSGGRFKPADRRGPDSCSWDRSTREDGFRSYLVGIDPTVGAELSLVPFAVVTTVTGFPAVLTHNQYRSYETQCIVILDVAPGQTVQVNYDYNGPRLPLTREETCGKAQQAAEMVMQNLINGQGAN
jgi:hypothetical protein